MFALRPLSICILLSIVFLLQTCDVIQNSNEPEIEAQIGLDIVDIPENPGYKSGYALRYTLRNTTGQDIFMIIPEVAIWRVGTSRQLQVYDYLAKYHHMSPDAEFEVLDTAYFDFRKKNETLAVRMMGKEEKLNLENRRVEDVNDWINAGAFVFLRNGEEFHYTQGITGIQKDKGTYKILLQSRTFRPRHFQIPNRYDTYYYVQPRIKSDTFNIIIR